MHAQQAARAFHERCALSAFVTGLAFDQGSLTRLTGIFPSPLNERVAKELQRRAITEVPGNLVDSRICLETLRALLSRFVRNPIYADMAWDLSSHRFDRYVAKRHLKDIQAVCAFEYTARYTFEEARRRGVATILALPSLDSQEFEHIKLREAARYPELQEKHEKYFAARFPARYARRRAEIKLADVIVANSEVTRLSHIRAGTDPAKIVAVPLASPAAIEVVSKRESDLNGPLRVVWAGNVSIGKGAHYFIDAWRTLNMQNRARACVYGSIALPDRILRPTPEGIDFKGSVPRQDLLRVFETADVLVFPTLSDGFGMVVTEAFSRGLPVITTDKAGASALVEQGRNGLIIPAADAAALAEALRWCLDNRGALYQMRFDALATARRWQWIDYRRALIAKITDGLRRAGYATDFGPDTSLPAMSS